jgi:hypothetical protein
VSWTTLAALPARLDPGNGEARRWLERELADPAYRDTRDPVQRALDALLRWLVDLLSGVSGPDEPLPSVVAGIVALALLGLALFALRQVRRGRRLRADAPPPVLGTERLTADEYRERARRAFAQDRYAACVLDALRAVASGAVERTLLEDAPSLTAHEIADRLSSVFPDHADGLHRSADRFDAVAYGDEVPTREQARAVLDLDVALLAARPRPAERTPAGAGVVLP